MPPEDTPATLAAALAGGLAVLAAFEAWVWLAAQGPRLRGVLEPLMRAGSDGYQPSGGERRRLALAGGLVAAALGALLVSLPAGIALALGAPAATAATIASRRARYRRSLAAATADLASAVAEPLAAGRSVRSAIAEAARGLDGSCGRELERARVALELGEDVDTALGPLRRAAASATIDALSAALSSRDVPGEDLVVLLRRLGSAAAERERVMADARAATAQARFTGVLVVAMPAGAGLFAELISPGFVARVLQAPGGAPIVLLALGLQAAGFAVIRRLAAPVEVSLGRGRPDAPAPAAASAPATSGP